MDANTPVSRRLWLGRLLALSGPALLTACTGKAMTASQAAGTESPTQSMGSPAGTATGPGDVPGGGGVAAETPAPALACVVRPQQTEGPYFVDERLNRADIRSDPSDGSVRPGLPLRLTMRVFQVAGSGCSPLSGAMVDVWHCDAAGQYSDVRDAAQGFSTVGKKFLRGYQLTDGSGAVTFTTVYPGWYQGRAVHIHFKIRAGSSGTAVREFTSQLYFEDSLSDQVYAQQPYAAKGGQRTRNNQDGIYRDGGSQLTLQPVKEGDGYAATFDIGLQG